MLPKPRAHWPNRRMAPLPLWMPGGLTGAFIGQRPVFFVIVKADAALGFAASHLLGCSWW
ncbi:MAG: hypothetical protein Q8K21_08435 [Hydrogenophaga sp.]|uniref:hypothetical protein n=1 Tax=Hydrogenophaga sp. TaxID=1904254 RepID=UPI0027300BE0|nr:hypothetical protein [Hydrogenophaga sp.]MDP2164234.1 hypothetical protein [Hydrogenophaga sp.]MDP3475653.1 hypothetical protein [Hydrogenophaga sp.]